MTYKRFFLIVGIGALCVIVVLVGKPLSFGLQSQQKTSSNIPQAAEISNSQHREVTDFVAGSFDTDVDGALNLDSNQNFVADEHALRLFEFFFIQTGELSEQDIAIRIRRWIEHMLTGGARLQALEFLQRFLDYRQLAKNYFRQHGTPADPAQRLKVITQLRLQAFGESLYKELFSEQEQRQLARLRRIENPELIEDPAGAMMGLSDAEIRVAERGQQVMQAQVFSESAASDEELWQQRYESFGHEAAYRLADLDRKRRQWEIRLNSYREKKKSIDDNSEFSESEKRQEIAQLLSQKFDHTEAQRVKALDHIGVMQGVD